MICYAINVQVENEHLTYRLIRQLTRYNPDQSILIITNGYASKVLEAICKEFNFHYLAGKTFFNNTSDEGKLNDQMMKYYLEYSNESILINIDPACYIWRSFNQSLPITDLFGFIVKVDNFQYFKKGVYGIWRSPVKEIIKSNLLTSQQFVNEEIELNLIGRIAKKLNFSMSGWDEIDISNHTFTPRNINLTYAVTYPHD